ncbi:MAG TPA: MMPL family transporter, partial [Solirubrobacteraceae bacterium]
MRSVTQLALRSPKVAILGWIALVIVLGLIGQGLEGRLHATDLRVDGSSSAQTRALVAEQFGESATIPVLLSGPSRDVRSQGRKLVARLQRERGVAVVSPWNAGPGRKALRPAADRVLMLVSISGDSARVTREAQRVRTIADDVAHGPVRAQVTGVPLAARDVASASWRAIHRADLIALPALLLVLLLVFRRPFAAALPVALGASTVWAANGVLALVARPLQLDAFATGIAAMVGLALAVDYSLLMVTRVRELRREGIAHPEAVARAGDATRHTVVAAGAAIVLAMILVAALSPTRAMLSAAVGVCSVAVLAVIGATLALPAALLLSGGRVGMATGGSRRSVWAPLTAVVTRRPALAGGLAAVALIALALPALNLRIGAPDARELPASNAARTDFEAIRNVSGPGWSAGLEVVAVANRGAMTTPKRLRALADLEARLRRDPAVREVFGPGSIAKHAASLRRAGRALARERRKLMSAAPRQARGLDRLAG